jgi:hypothetical protein
MAWSVSWRTLVDRSIGEKEITVSHGRSYWRWCISCVISNSISWDDISKYELIMQHSHGFVVHRNQLVNKRDGQNNWKSTTSSWNIGLANNTGMLMHYHAGLAQNEIACAMKMGNLNKQSAFFHL